MLLAGKLVSRNSDLHREPFYGGGKEELFSLTKPNVGRPLINAQVSRERAKAKLLWPQCGL